MPETNCARLLLGHKEVEVAWYGSRSYIDQKYAGCLSEFVLNW